VDGDSWFVGAGGLFGEVFNEDVFESDFQLVVFVDLQGDVAVAADVVLFVYGIVEYPITIIVCDSDAVQDGRNLRTDGGYLQVVPVSRLVAVIED